MVARTEGAAMVRILRVALDGTITGSGDEAVAADRMLSVTTRLEDLVLVDAGAPAEAWLRLRVLAPDLSVEVDGSPPPAWTYDTPSPVAALGAPSGSGLLFAFYDRTADGLLRTGIVRADCSDASR